MLREEGASEDLDCEATQAYGLGDGGEDDSTTGSEDDEAKTALTSLPAISKEKGKRAMFRVPLIVLLLLLLLVVVVVCS